MDIYKIRGIISKF